MRGVKEQMHDTDEVLPRRQPYVTRGEVVRRLRGVKGWSQEKLGEMAGGMSRNTVRDAESDLPTVTGETWEKIASAFDLDVSDLDVQKHAGGVDPGLVSSAYNLLHRALFSPSSASHEDAARVEGLVRGQSVPGEERPDPTGEDGEHQKKDPA